MNRVNNPSKHLHGIIENGQKYYIGFGQKELTELGKKNNDIQELITNKRTRIIVKGRTGVLKENTLGKYIRKQPERKTSVWKHIEYYSTKHEKQIAYDREFNIWEKELLHKFDLELSKHITPQGETIFCFPLFKKEDTDIHYLKAGAAMNMAILLGKYFMFYTENLEPIIPVTKVKDSSILPAGQYGSVREKLEVIAENLKLANGAKDNTGNSYRFALLKDHNPDEVTIGLGGFNEYLMFEYEKDDLIILENLRSGNASYIFRLSKFDKNKELDKQNAKEDPSFIERIIHNNMEEWERKMGKFF
jgi:hypothetical protein